MEKRYHVALQMRGKGQVVISCAWEPEEFIHFGWLPRKTTFFLLHIVRIFASGKQVFWA